LWRQPLRPKAAGEGGPHWRAPGADANVVGHVVRVGADEYLATDGSRGIIPFRWPADQAWTQRPTVMLPGRVVAPPVLVPGAGPARVLVADATGGVSLLQGPSWEPLRRWECGGKITAGPFRRGSGYGCVVDRRELLWLEPDREEIVWRYTAAGPIVGQPPLVAGRLIVADQAGRIVALDPATGLMAGSGYVLSDQLVPAAAPVEFGTERLLVPMSDGTALLLPLEKLAPSPPRPNPASGNS
ncbi:MAG: PQQ-binding-like beta-propeller repeat protein, partial [Gemmataceae bacterium]|nr:PQQ-binding-like beta-propeller repeat protein [Gemmataceae bacterium]